MTNPDENDALNQFHGLARIRAIAGGHDVTQDEDGGHTCACGYGLGNSSGDLEGRYRAHVASVTPPEKP